MSYAFDTRLTRKQIEVGLNGSSRFIAKRGGAGLFPLLTLLSATLTIAGALAVVWVGHFLLTDTQPLPFPLILIGTGLGVAFGILSQKLTLAAMARGTMEGSWLSAPARFSVSSEGVRTQGSGVDLSATWASTDCIVFLSTAMVFVLPKSDVADVPAFLADVRAWHKTGQS
ncbi:hypothetical protein [Aliiroseovarius subalbicans]|uniref:hypothetical protein n=1 Tax=Aliiroseovarius subalbicans TaxID=2925840 RepID=UPI001F56943C|nr:hypothetical protein [Aliiroseovarius subalbicans]MCI2399577.1 hypothetical protein [Aliiroseovarius subalbicans]